MYTTSQTRHQRHLSWGKEYTDSHEAQILQNENLRTQYTSQKSARNACHRITSIYIDFTPFQSVTWVIRSPTLIGRNDAQALRLQTFKLSQLATSPNQHLTPNHLPRRPCLEQESPKPDTSTRNPSDVPFHEVDDS